MAYVDKEGTYRCRLVQDTDTGKACIAVTEHYAWDNIAKRVDTNKSLGGLQLVLKADAWLLDADGNPSGERLDLNLNPFGYTIITKREDGERVLDDRISAIVEAFNLPDASSLTQLSTLDHNALLDATFDVRVYFTQSKKIQGKKFTNYYIAPAGKASPKPKAFDVATSAQSTLDRLRAKLRVECAKAPTPTPAPTPSLPARSAPPPAPALPSREAVQGWTPTTLWESWYAKHQDDARGDAFYNALREMYGDAVELESLTAEQLNAFALRHSLTYNDNSEILF